MNLSREDADLFFKLMWAVQFYVNRRLNLVPGVASAEDYKKLSREQKFEVREALFAHMQLLDAFVSENPARLPPEQLQIVQGWKRHVAGKFYILRFLKRYVIFVSAAKSARVYGVLGLYDRLEDVLPALPLPVFVEAVLLPFKGRIVHDGLFVPYSILFGAGIRGDLNEIYQRAKQAGAIIESLEPGTGTARSPKPKKPRRDWRPALDNIVETTEQLRRAETIIQTRAFGVLKAGARLAQAAARNSNNLNELYQLTHRTRIAVEQMEKTLDRAQ